MPAVLTFAPIRGATEDEQQCYEALKFQSTRPLRGATLHVVVEHVFLVISIHAPLTGRDVRQVGLCLLQRLISIHVPPTGHDTQSIAYLYECLEFQSTCPVRGTTGITNT